jgi:hypothetical protein
MKFKLLFLVLVFFTSNVYTQMPPAAPDTLNWPVDKSFMELSWQPEIVDASGSSVNYDVSEFAEGKVVINKFLGNTSDTLFVVGRPVAGIYRYGIIAIDVSGNRADLFYSDFISVVEPDTTPPFVPVNIKVSVRFLDTRLGAIGFDGSFEHESDTENYVLNYTKDDTSRFQSIVIGRDKEFIIALSEPHWFSVGVAGFPDSVRPRWVRTVEQ